MRWMMAISLGVLAAGTASAGVGDRVGASAGHSPAGVPEVHDGLHNRVDVGGADTGRDWMQPPRHTAPSRGSSATAAGAGDTLGPAPSRPRLGHPGGPELGRMPPVRGPHHGH